MPQDRPYTPAEQAEISSRFPNIEWINGRPFTRVEEPASEVAGYDAQGNPIDYLGNPVQFQEQLVPANLTDSFPWWFLAAQVGGPAAADAVGGLLSGGAAGGGSAASAAAPSAAPSLSAPVMGVETLAGGAASGGGGGLAAALSGTGVGGTLLNTGIKALGSYLADDEEEGPYRFSDVDPDSELGRFTHPQNALYNSLRSAYGLGVGLADRLSKPISLPSLPGSTQSINIPGLPFSLGGVGSDSGPTTLPGLDMSALLPFLKDLTARPAATPAVSTAQTQAGTVQTPNRAGPRRRLPGVR